MDGIRGWLLGISFAALTGGLVYMLSPKGATDRSVRIAVSLFILITALSPFMNGSVTFSTNSIFDKAISDSGDLSDALYEQIADNVAEAAKVQTKDVLEQYGLKDCGIEVNVTQSDGVVYAARINVISREGYLGCERSIKSEITKMTGTEDVVLE